MLFRYQLVVETLDQTVFDGCFSSINKLVKVACCFNKSICCLKAYDFIYDKELPLYDLMTEFVANCNGI